MEGSTGGGGGGVVSAGQPRAHRAVALAFILPGLALLVGDCIDLNPQGPSVLAVGLMVIGVWMAGGFERAFWIRPLPEEFAPPGDADPAEWSRVSLLFDQDAPVLTPDQH